MGKNEGTGERVPLYLCLCGVRRGVSSPLDANITGTLLFLFFVFIYFSSFLYLSFIYNIRVGGSKGGVCLVFVKTQNFNLSKYIF